MEPRRGRGLRLEWRETRRPPVSPPARQGFGTRLVRALITRQLGGEVIMDWRPDGLCCVFALPGDALGPRSADRG